ncbi:hypothetical protein GCM10022223_15690 [Kineosporia mesophila]|uniref:Uncharacterized protein n=1 Tax=Kineosporia mesophila TaxID=566012 RepID=A0ABP6Z7I8_9ACTN
MSAVVATDDTTVIDSVAAFAEAGDQAVTATPMIPPSKPNLIRAAAFMAWSHS